MKLIVSDTSMSLFRVSWSHLLPGPQLFAQSPPPRQPPDAVKTRAVPLPEVDGSSASQSFWLLLPLPDSGDILCYGVWLPQQLVTGSCD